MASWQSHQVLDLPQGLKLTTTEHRASLKKCPHCHKLNQAALPEEAAHYVQYGPQLRALAVYLSQVQLLPNTRPPIRADTPEGENYRFLDLTNQIGC